MKRIERKSDLPQFFSFIPMMIGIAVAGAMLSCSKPAPQSQPVSARPSDIKVEVRNGGPVVVTTNAAEFQILPSGSVQAVLLKDGQRLTLDGRGQATAGDSIVHEGKDLDFIPDLAHAKILEATGKLGRGKRVEIPAQAASAGVASTLV